jgi:hypothetical protein
MILKLGASYQGWCHGSLGCQKFCTQGLEKREERFIKNSCFCKVMEANKDKTLFELYPELEIKLRELREQAKRLGLWGKLEFS